METFIIVLLALTGVIVGVSLFSSELMSQILEYHVGMLKSEHSSVLARSLCCSVEKTLMACF